MQTKRIAILFSGNGSNLEALIRALHQKCFISKKLERDSQSNMKNEGFLIGGIAHSFTLLEPNALTDSKYTKLESKNLKSAQSRDSTMQENAPFKVEVVLALSNKANAYGLKRAESLGVATKVIESAGKAREDFDKEVVATLQALQLDLCVLAGFMRILTPLFTQNIHAINIHPSLLPLFKGAHGIAESYASPMRLGGVSVHYVSEELDSGEIIAQGVLAKNANESLESYESRIHQLEHQLYPLAVLEALNQGIK
ncbi:phosphoribosylglycinamide formyltransferase [Helicobacter sp. MIT 05-5294]|uniref:phosphoribosylglycinamide formyltransferase n=1 Tax=Helicobacter sp. MIT 05-5294 TaxID=1548150 RepID=UPI00051F9451|nr:phosphoribosylglycinamide formyltransferase [Helicobacter sp. MIT 05-5294]TLD89201.1 phosphoribosylglycinamide formyltransferase [Helicobacter sp. MIT 05-5294]